MKKYIFITLAAVFLQGCKSEVQLREKFSEDYKYDLEVIHIKSSLGKSRVELRDKNGLRLADPVLLNYDGLEYCEFFFAESVPGKVSVCVNVGDKQWVWEKDSRGNWVITEEMQTRAN